MNQDYDYLIKAVVIGDSGVGKSCLIMRYCDACYTDSYISTIGVDFKIRSFEFDGKTVKFQVWDTAGQERFRTITTSYYRGAHCIMFVFDITNRETFDNIKRIWYDEVKRIIGDKEISTILIGTKSDLEVKRAVSFTEATELAKNHGMKYIETSAKVEKNVDEAFLDLASSTVDRLKRKPLVPPNKIDHPIVIGRKVKPVKDGCC
ncbi:MAG: GTP-binding protein ypt1 [Terrestrivirus sp.]|uniref:GTP-binding protein ypt1 n=1 Tax=Terrestrivirus sp. TaxID=2487775 RepID=A0A3G4ZLS3_9VIRU|nr:MAG: GTP-binding protein ypt1 [Terrestrivirus sp.]